MIQFTIYETVLMATKEIAYKSKLNEKCEIIQIEILF